MGIVQGEFIVYDSSRGATVSSFLFRGGLGGKVGKGILNRSHRSTAAS